MTTHVLSVSSEGVVRTLRNQFTRSTTFLSEALQNARRAGASAVRVDWDAINNVMTIADDGSGIANFDALFTLGRSGWDAETIAEENPFGVGFMASVLASERISIRTLDRQVEFETRALLNFSPIEVKKIPSGAYKGTELKLTLRPHLPPKSSFIQQPPDSTKRWHAVLIEIVIGFPIPVYFNGALLERPRALNAGARFLETEVGQLYLSGYDECRPHDMHVMPALYYQGLPVEGPNNRIGASPDTLHLDPQRFRPRMPDRDTLVDATEQWSLIYKAIEEVWRKRLMERHGEINRQEFVDKHWKLCVKLLLPELLRDAPLSRSMLERYHSPIDVTDDLRAELEEWGDESLPGKEAVFINRFDGEYCASVGDPPAPLASVYAIVHRLPVLDERVPNCHWANQRYVDLLDEELGLTYDINGPTKRAHYRGEWISCDVVVCKSVTVSIKPTALCEIPAKLYTHLTPVVVDDQAFYDPDKGCLIVTSNTQAPGEVIKQLSNYRDEHERWLDSEYERDLRGVTDLVASLRSKSPHAYLESLLQHVHPDGKLLGKHTFTVRYDHERSRLVVNRSRKK